MEGMVGTIRTLVYWNIKAYITEHGYAPTCEELARMIGTSKSVVSRNISKLCEEGLLETDVENSWASHRAYRVKGQKVSFDG